ncbi:MAG: hypothetical protein ACT4PL_04935 [Phycisphaerales bacterium]
MPLVMLLGIAASFAVSIMLAHQARLRMAERQHANSYQFHHAQQGIGLAAELFLRRPTRTPRPETGAPSVSVETPAAPIDDLGTSQFALDFPDGSRAEFLFTDAQGTLLDDQSDGASDVMRRAALDLRTRRDAPQLVRTRGPEQVSINAAPLAVLERIIAHGAPGSPAQDAAQKIDELRRERRIDTSNLKSIIQQSGIDEKYTEVFTGYVDNRVRPPQTYSGVFVTDPSLRTLTVTLRASSGRELNRYLGTILFDPAVAGVGGSRAQIAFLSWEELGPSDAPRSLPQ